MAKPYKKENAEKVNLEPITPYLAAKQEWDERIGASRVQAQNWRFFAVLLLLVIFLLLVSLLRTLTLPQTKVYVAEVTKEGRVVNVAPLTVAYQPTVAQEEYFITQVITMMRSLSLDPVVTKQNLLNVYYYLTQGSSQKLNAALRESNPLESLGKKTITVEITDINPISSNSFQVGWTETSVDVSGQQLGQQRFSGVFTISVHAPRSQKEILINPLGIYIVDFNISARV